jgi:lantibiotic modifying enzyme
MKDLGLYHGKTGVVLFFSHYARYIGEPLYNEFAGELLEEIIQALHTDLSIDFESGICGIGWGVNYLIQNNFMEGDINEILFEIDQKIMERDIRHTTDMSCTCGLAGISYYVHSRISSFKENQEHYIFNKSYLKEWKTIANSIDFPDNQHILFSIVNPLPKEEDLLMWNLGLYKGCAGVGLKAILES